MTGAAFRWFADVAVDVAVVEVGLGGTWDATNVIDADVAVVTNVSLDHSQYLGDTPAQIATEKAGIVKTGSTLVLGETDPDLVAIFADRGAARVLRRDVDFGTRAQRARRSAAGCSSSSRPAAAYPDVFLPLYGAHQGDNAAIALAAAEVLRRRAARGRGRLRRVRACAFARAGSRSCGRQPLVLLDGAHNVAGAEALRAALAEEFAPAPRTLVVGLLREKDPIEMLTALGARRRRAARVRAGRRTRARWLPT